MKTLQSKLGKKLNLIPTEMITVEYKGERFDIYEHECRHLQILVAKKELSMEDIKVYSLEGEEVRFREDGRFCDELKQYQLCIDLAFEIL